jgi:hypothetical protein
MRSTQTPLRRFGKKVKSSSDSLLAFLVTNNEQFRQERNDPIAEHQQIAGSRRALGLHHELREFAKRLSFSDDRAQTF